MARNVLPVGRFVRLTTTGGRRLFIATGMLAAACSTLLGSQAPAPDQPQATFRSSVEAVQLSVIVTDSAGRPVPGLTEADFEVLENGDARPITTFSAVDIPIERVERATGQPDIVSNDGPPGRLYVIALDRMRADSALRTRAFLRQFIETSLGPNDAAAVLLTTEIARRTFAAPRTSSGVKNEPYIGCHDRMSGRSTLVPSTCVFQLALP